MNIAFYAPMKSPDHPQPSGDRLIARNTMAALELAGHNVTLASSLRSWEGNGDRETQIKIEQDATKEANNLSTQYAQNINAKPDLWFTYHAYHKSPDWLGPAVSKSLGIPYVLMETSHSRNKPRNAAWQQGLDQTRHSIESAALVISINRADMEGVDRVRSVRSDHCYVPPFIDTSASSSETHTAGATSTNTDNRLLTVAMMRHGDKLESYKILAEAISLLNTKTWQLDIVGTGQAHSEVEALFEQLPKPPIDQQLSKKIEFHGELAPADVSRLMNKADFLVWPGINEALGMVYLEAQACGLPIIAGKMAGTADLVEHQQSGWLVANTNAINIASAIDHACTLTRQQRNNMATAAREYCHSQHSITAAAQHIDTALNGINRPAWINA